MASSRRRANGSFDYNAALSEIDVLMKSQPPHPPSISPYLASPSSVSPSGSDSIAFTFQSASPRTTDDNLSPTSTYSERYSDRYSNERDITALTAAISFNESDKKWSGPQYFPPMSSKDQQDNYQQRSPREPRVVAVYPQLPVKVTNRFSSNSHVIREPNILQAPVKSNVKITRVEIQAHQRQDSLKLPPKIQFVPKTREQVQALKIQQDPTILSTLVTFVHDGLKTEKLITSTTTAISMLEELELGFSFNIYEVCNDTIRRPVRHWENLYDVIKNWTWPREFHCIEAHASETHITTIASLRGKFPRVQGWLWYVFCFLNWINRMFKNQRFHKIFAILRDDTLFYTDENDSVCFIFNSFRRNKNRYWSS
jgi:hypothetical protein